MKRNLVLCGLFLFAAVLTTAVDAMAQGVQFNVSATPRDVRRIGTAEAVAGVLLTAGSGGTVSQFTTIDINYGTAVTGLPALTGTCAAAATCTAAIPVGAPNIVRITYGANQLYAIGNSDTVIGVRVNANTYPAATIIPTLSAAIPAGGNAVTFTILGGFAVATIKDPATAVDVTAGGGILTCVPSDTGKFTVKVAESAGFPAALTSATDETNLGGIPAGGAAVSTVIRMSFADVPVGVSIVANNTAGTSTSLIVTADPVLGTVLTSETDAQTLDFDFSVTSTSTVAPEEALVVNFGAETAGAIALGSVSQKVKVSLLGGTGLLQVPRFVTNTQGSGTAFGVSDCVTNLLFPWVANVAGYDTGIAIANTTKDPFGVANGGAVAQAGSCTLTGYPAATGTPSVSFTSASVPAGAAFTMVLSDTVKNPAFNGFVGYIIAVCQFQNAHAFAYITDNFGVGAPNTAQGYVALVIPNPTIVARNPAGEGGRGESFGE